jgi:hypothetical protein
VEILLGATALLKDHTPLHLKEIPLLAVMEIIPTEGEIQAVIVEEIQVAITVVIHVDKGIEMKKLIIVAAMFIFISFTGCYTVVWSPGMDISSTDTLNSYDSSYNSDGNGYSEFYYNEPYFGPYAPYYNEPWWYSFPLVTVSGGSPKNNGKTSEGRSGDAGLIRNSGDGRGNSGRNTGEVINTPPVTVSGSGSSSSGSKSGGEHKRNDSSSDNKNDNSRQSSGSSNVRNNDGSRNDGGRK